MSYQYYATDDATLAQTDILGFATASPVPEGGVVELLGCPYTVSFPQPGRDAYLVGLQPFQPTAVLSVAHQVQFAPPATYPVHFKSPSW